MSPRGPTVAIIGGGVAGLSAAHELAERGFRFFPSFYRHLPDTMRRIPFGTNPNGVADNLVATSRTRLARIDAPPVDVLTRFPSGLRDLADLARMFVKIDLDLPREDMLFVGR